MRFIRTKFDGVFDYLVGILLIAAPWLLKFNNGTAAQWVPVIVGAMYILMSVFTNYEAGIVKSIRMSMRLNLDILVGIFLAASPWLFGFSNQIYLPHLVVGILLVVEGLVTETAPHPQVREEMGRDQDMRQAH